MRKNNLNAEQVSYKCKNKTNQQKQINKQMEI